MLPENRYYEHFAKKFELFVGKYCKFNEWPQHINLDCSDGIGGIQMKKFAPYLEKYLTFDIKNCGAWPEESKEITLNANCGAEFVQK